MSVPVFKMPSSHSFAAAPQADAPCAENSLNSRNCNRSIQLVFLKMSSLLFRDLFSIYFVGSDSPFSRKLLTIILCFPQIPGYHRPLIAQSVDIQEDLINT